MEGKESLKEMNMGKLWALARSKGIQFKGMKKPDLIKALVAADSPKEKPVAKKPEKETKPKIVKETMVEAVLEDGTKVLIPAKDVSPAVKVEDDGMVVIKSVDGRDLEASVGITHWVGKEIRVPKEQLEEVKRLLKDGGYYFV